MHKTWLKICCIVLVLAMLANMLPMTVFAQEFRESISATEQAETVTPIEAEDAYIVSEITENRTEFSKEFQLSNGLRMAAVYADAVHYETDNGWEEIDNTLVAKLDGTYANTAGVWDVRFPSQLSKTKGVAIEKDGYTLSFYMAGELNSDHELMSATEPVIAEELEIAAETSLTANIAPTLALEVTAEQLTVTDVQISTVAIHEIDNTAIKESMQYEEMAPEKVHSRLSYSNVFPNTQVVYDLDSNKIKESIVLNAYSQSLRGYRYTLHTGEMIPVLEESGQILFYDKAQENIVMVMPAPYLVDNAGEYNSDIRVTLTGSNGVYTLTYTLPTQWLAAQDRAWPVILDPVVQASLDVSNIRDRTVSQKKTFEQTWGMNTCGYDTDTGIMRFFLKYDDLPDLTSSDVVVSASVQMYKPNVSGTVTQVEVHKVNSTWTSEGITWANQPAFNTNIEDYAIVDAVNWYGWVVTDIVRDWYTNQNTGMLFKASSAIEGGGTANFKQFLSSDYGIAESRPVLSIEFRNNNGVEGYWDYTTSSAGRAGTGYVNNYTGNLVWARADMGFEGNRMPVSITSVYNANDAVCPSDNNNSNDTAGNSFGMGNGWRTNFNQLVYHWEIDGETEDYYVWEDEDGTDHYFKYDSANTYKDEDGLELTLKTDGSGDSKYTITTKYGDTRHFDANGRLTKLSNNQQTKSEITITYKNATSRLISKITDGAGRSYNFVYSNDFLSQILYVGTGSETLSSVTYNYTDSCLTRVTYADSEAVNYTYNTDKMLLTAQDIDGYKLTYTYHPRSGGSWQPYRVASVAESHQKDDSTAAGGSLSFAYAHNQTTLTDHNTNVEILQFNDMGNTVSIQDDEGHAQYAKFAKNSADETGKGNQLKVASKLQYTVGNRIADTSFEHNDGLTTTHSSVSTAFSTEEKYIGNKSLKVTTSAANTTSGVYAGALQVAADETCTYSIYVKAVSADVSLLLKVGNEVVATSEEVIAGSEWTRLQVSYSNDTSASVGVSCYMVTEDAGTFYLDCLQREFAETASRYNMVSNGDFHITSVPGYLWSKSSGCTSADTLASVAAAVPQLDNNVFKLTGSPTAQKQLSQTINVSGSKDDTYVLAGWAKGNSAPLKGFDSRAREFTIRAKFNYTDGTETKYFTAQFNPDSNVWQYSATVMVAEGAYSSIQVQIVYDYNVNTAYFDGIQLYKEQFGNSYTYDKDGNVISVQDLQAKTTTYEYENNDLTQIIQDNKAKMTYTYDDYHNVLTAKSTEELTYSFAYDTYGNNTSVSIGTGDTKITSSAEYSDNGNYLVSTTDALGKTTTYGYNENTNMLDWVRHPEDTEETKTTYTYDKMYRMAETAANVKGINDSTQKMWAKYTYEDDLLKSIQTPTTIYNFEYGNFGLRSKVKIGDNRTLATYTYTEKNNYLSSIDYGNDGIVEYEYDNKGRLIKQTYDGGDTVTYTYDNSGALAKVYDSATGITTTNYYDFTDRLMKYVESGSGFNHSVGYEYDDKNNLTKLVETINGTAHTTEYAYDDDNRVTSVTADGTTVTYSYDAFGRVTQQVTKNGDTVVTTETFTYVNPTANTTSAQIATHTVVTAGKTYSYAYTYDDNGNITSISTGSSAFEYVYDSANQLIRENDPEDGYTNVWTYDEAGNIQSKTIYEYIPGNLNGETPNETVDYAYGDPKWGDLLTRYNGHNVYYDDIGNIECYRNWSYTWEHGRELASLSDGTTNWSFEYDANGMRTKRTSGADTYTYVYNGSQLTRLTKSSNTLDFSYDATGKPLTVTYNGATYYYITNIQGDVVAIVDGNGVQVAVYMYDAWGRHTYANGQSGNALYQLNPLRYRGYVYDTETELYYLQSRYYNPEIGRFINADNYPATGQGLLGNNMFAYCQNKPVVHKDTCGEAIETIWDIVSLGASIAEVVANPSDPWAWAGLIGDVIDVALPGVGGLGEAVDAAKAMVHVVEGVDDVVDTAKALRRAANSADDIKSATGAYIVLYESGQHYIGKGGFKRAITSAVERLTDANSVSAIIWAPTSSSDSAFVTEFLLQTVYGVGGEILENFNKIWSPGNKILQALQ